MRTVLGRLGLMPLAKPLTSKEGHRTLELDRYRCQYCGPDAMANFENSLVLTVDFVLPRARRGGKKPDNLVAACRACNVIKGHRVFHNFEVRPASYSNPANFNSSRNCDSVRMSMAWAARRPSRSKRKLFGMPSTLNAAFTFRSGSSATVKL